MSNLFKIIFFVLLVSKCVFSKSECIPDENNCIECDSKTNFCSKCKPYYYIDKSDPENQCKYSFAGNLYYCLESEDGKTCSKCDSKYTLSDDKQCTSIHHCSIVGENPYMWEKCQKGYFLSNYGGACNSKENCKEEDPETGFCIRCEYQHYLNITDGTCISNQDENIFKNCEKASEKCQSCERYIYQYYLGEDFKCSLSKYCAESDSDGNCIKCQKNYFLGSLDNNCVGVENCAISNNFETCVECNKGYYYSQKFLSCEQEEKNLKNCKIASDKKSCIECRDGFYLNQKDNLCYPNNNEEEVGRELYKCALTDSSGEKCLKCEKGAYYGNTDKKCTSVQGCEK